MICLLAISCSPEADQHDTAPSCQDGSPPDEWYPDADADGYGIPWGSTISCEPPAGTAPEVGDCDDDDPSIHPGAPELCDGIDNDCNPALGDEASFTTADGQVVPLSERLATGSADEPLLVRLAAPGRLELCAGTWFASLDISADVEVVGAGSGVTTLDAAYEGPVVPIGSDTVTSLRGLTLQGGRADYGGGIAAWARSTVVIDDVPLRDDVAGECGGGLYALDAAGEILNSTITESASSSHGGGAGVGSALCLVGGSWDIESSTITENFTRSDNDGNSGGEVGAIVVSAGEFSISNSEVSDNSAADGTGGLLCSDASLDISGSVFSGNESDSADAPHPEYYNLHAIYADNCSGTIADSLVMSNFGGGVFVAGSTFSIDRTVVKENLADECAGGIYVSGGSDVELTGSSVTGNAAACGGGLAVADSVCRMTDTVVEANEASGTGGGMVIAYESSVEIDGGRIAGNAAAAGGGAYLATADDIQGDQLESRDADWGIDDGDNTPSDVAIQGLDDAYAYGEAASFTCDSTGCR